MADANKAALISHLQAAVDGPRDGALLRFALGNALLDEDPAAAAEAFAAATDFDPEYSAAWKLRGKALVATGDSAGAIDAYRSGIAAAERSGDIQAGKEMRVFLQRLQKT